MDRSPVKRRFKHDLRIRGSTSRRSSRAVLQGKVSAVILDLFAGGSLEFRGFFFDRGKVALFATMNKTFRHGLQFFPTRADSPGFLLCDPVIGSRDRNDGQKIGELLHDHVRGGDEEIRMWPVVFWILDEKSARAF